MHPASSLLRLSLTAVVSIAAIVTSLGAPEHAQAAEGPGMTGEVGLFTGYVGFGRNSGLGNASYRYDVPSPAVAVGLRGGFFPSRAWGVEVSGRYSSTAFRDPTEFNQPKEEPNIAAYSEGGTATVLGARVLGRYNFLLGNDTITPFVTLGGGIDVLDSDKSYTQNGAVFPAVKRNDVDWAVEVGGGLNVKLTHALRLRVDAGYFLGEPAAERQYIKGGGGAVHNFQVLAGVQVVLGGPAGDSDGDGLKDNLDKCPEKAEDKDGFKDDDGCPDLDNDSDGVLDAEDKCPNKAEDKDGFKDYDGCPDLDNDNDGVPDNKDKCPLKKEDRDGFQDGDGCPDTDNDKDGLPDKQDKCPNKAEDPDGYQDNDGCPDLDDDGDGVPDKADKCPRKAETPNKFQDDDGCPDELPAAVVTLTSAPLYGVVFGRKGGIKARRSKKALAPVLEVMTAHTGLSYELICHVDMPRRKKKKKDPQAISVKRCEALKAWLVTNGVSQRRLKARGVGDSQPLPDNTGRKAYKKNTRIEIKLR